MSLAGTSLIVFGATGGIGSAVCGLAVAQGARVLACGRSEERLAALAQQTGAEWCLADATRWDQVDAAVSDALRRFGKLDGAVNCAGSLLLKPAHLTTMAEYEATMAANVTSAFGVVRAATKAMTEAGGSIVLMSSAAAQTGLANHEAIAAAKGAVVGLTLSAAASYAPRRIRVNAVAPGLIRTPLTQRITSNEASLKASTAMHALGRIGEATEVASAVAWLLDPAQGFVTGQVLGIDGGLGHVRPR